MKSSIFASIFAVALFTQGCVIVDDGGSDATLTIDNASSYTITEFYVTSVGSSTWGPDLLGADVLYPDERYTVYVDCDYYDVWIVYEDGCETFIYDEYLCFSDSYYVLNDNDYTSC